MQRRLDACLAQQYPGSIALVSLALVALTGAIDYVMGFELSFSINVANS
ncbi:MAG: hypothetical protein AB7Q97_18310 [Gammaproteobacteria bacterium]